MVLILPVSPPEEGVVYTSGNIKLKIGEKDVGYGVLYLSPRTLAWQPDDLLEGLIVYWKNINVHGISTTPTKCLYFMIDQEVRWPGVYDLREVNGNARNGNNLQERNEEPMEQQQNIGDGAPEEDEEDEGNVTDEENTPLTECWLYPDDLNSVEIIFRAMNDCQALNPDPAESLSEESDLDMEDDDNDEDVPDMQNPNNEDNDDAEGAQGHMRNLNINDNHFADAGDPS